VRYRVEITEPAQQNIQEAYDWLTAESSQAATTWIDGLLETIESLDTFPLRCRWRRRARTIRRKSDRSSAAPTGFCFLSES
jgi:plasmid stabilization system protein ParE